MHLNKGIKRVFLCDDRVPFKGISAHMIDSISLDEIYLFPWRVCLEIGESVALGRPYLPLLLGEPGADWNLGYPMFLSAMLWPEFFLFYPLVPRHPPRPSPLLNKDF